MLLYTCHSYLIVNVDRYGSAFDLDDTFPVC